MTAIEWTDETWNVMRGCTRVSPGCEHCYAEGEAVRVTDGPFTSYAGQVEAVHSLERLTVSINLLGRETPVELEAGQIEELAA